MEKIKLYTPKQIADIFGVCSNTIRRYEKKFNIVPILLPSGFRRYTEDHLNKFKKIFGY